MRELGRTAVDVYAVSTVQEEPGVRGMHSTVQLCHIDDIVATIQLLRIFLENAHEMTSIIEPSYNRSPQ